MSNKFLKACRNGRVKFVKSYIKKNGYDANKRLVGWINNGIYEAVLNDRLEIIKFFVECYPNQTDKDYVFIRSCIHYRINIIRYLVQTGYDRINVGNAMFGSNYLVDKNIEYCFTMFFICKLKVFMNYDKENKYRKMEITKRIFKGFTDYELMRMI